ESALQSPKIVKAAEIGESALPSPSFPSQSLALANTHFIFMSLGRVAEATPLLRRLRIPVIRSAEMHRLEVFAPVRVETLKQLADRVGISLGQARHLVHSGRLQHVRIGARRYVPEGAWERFITDNTVTPCLDATVVPNYAGSQSGSASTSHGPSTAAAAS